MSKLSDRRWWAIGALALAGLVVGLDTTVLNIALPALAEALHASSNSLQWIVDAYNLVLAAMMLPAGLLADRFGRKKMVLFALVLFGGASAVCAYAGSAGVLIAARAVLGLGGAFLIPLMVSVVPVLFSEEERPRAIAITVAAQGISFPLGPIIGGWLLNTFWWGSVFLINVPVTAVALIAVWLLLPESRDPNPPKVDLLGIVASAVGLTALTYGFIYAGDGGWGAPRAWGTMIVGTVVLVGFVLWERVTANPLIDLRLFRDRGFTWGVLMATTVNFAMFGALFAMPQFFQAVNGVDALGSGLRLLAIIGGLVIGSSLADRIAARAGRKATNAAGFVLLAVGLFVGSTMDVGVAYGFTGTWLAVAGLGLGFVFPTAMDAALGTLSAERSGIGSSLIQALRQVGATIGVAILGTILSAGYRSRLDVNGLPAQAADAVKKNVIGGVSVAQNLHDGDLLHSVQAAFVHGLDLMLVVSGAIAVVSAVLAIIFLPQKAPKPATGDGADEMTDATV